MISVHTSPLDPPGSGDAGGMNVYIAELAAHLAVEGVEVDVYTQGPHAITAANGCTVVSIPVGPRRRAGKDDLPGLLPGFAAAVLTAGRGPYDVIHSHYWLSGEVGAVLAAAWHVPLVHSMHTMAAVKNATDPSTREPAVRLAGEARLAATAAALIVNTADEAADLTTHYDAPAARVHVVSPGVDLAAFAPRSMAGAGPGDRSDRAALGLPAAEPIVLFVGRVQPHKGPDLLLRALAAMRERGLDTPRLVVIGGPSGAGDPGWFDDLADQLGVADVVDRRGPVPHAELARWYHAADLVAVPSRHESFGLVVLEAQAAGTPVVAAAVGGLRDAVRDGDSGVLIEGRDEDVWATVLHDLLADPARRRDLGIAARRHAQRFSWTATAERTLQVYAGALDPPSPREAGVAAVLAVLAAAGVDHATGRRPGEIVAQLPGEHRLATTVSLLVGAHTVSATAFVCRRPDDDAAGVHEWLLRRNTRLPGVAWAVDDRGDIYLVGRVPLGAVLAAGGERAVDDLLGGMAHTADESFDELLRRGFAAAIDRELQWRLARGLPATNLDALRPRAAD